MLADEDPLDRLKSTRVEIDRRLEGLARVNWECGRYLDDDGTVREPFGFADGIRQPAFFDFEDNPNALHWKPFAKLALLLTRDPSSTVQDDEYGSLMSFMKISENVTEFRAI